ncbi:MAG: TonB-dependent receptor [Acidobacteria bacterium]|nr:MAG: TonB-dependent receptor [Acidobacteriota bacterium]
MKSTRVLIMTVVAFLAASTAFAGPAGQQTPPPPPPTPPAQQTPPPEKPKDPTYQETVVVTASRTEQKIVDAPATMTVFTPKFLTDSPAANYGDLLRGVPGVNVTQLSARDINVTSRAATSSLSTSQLALVDGRSLYQDFFGFVMWDFMPANMNEIKQIEVIRGPASAVWGANAMNGVINVITKAPREMRGASVNMGFGSFNRTVTNNQTNAEVKQDAGTQFYLNGTVADAINDKWAFKISAGYSMSDPFARPLGNIPGSTTAYPAFTNDGTKQPKVDVRLDRDAADGSRLSFTGGTAGTTGIMESGIGPFQIKSGTIMSYGKLAYSKNAFHIHAFMNALDGEAPNLLSVDAAGKPVQLNFNTKTIDVEAGNSNVVGKNVFTYGGNLRVNRFHLTLAPGETSRTEGGGYLQDEFFINDHARLVAGARLDKFSSINKAVFSPRVALVLKPVPAQTFRVSYNRAFRAPSMINNNLDVTISTALPLASINPALGSAVFRVPTRATGNPDLTEEHTDAFEVSYTGKVGQKSLFTAAWYYMQAKNQIFFTVKSAYGLTSPPAGWTSLPFFPNLPTAIGTWSAVQSKANFPSEYTYKNLGEVKNQGLELGFESEYGPVSYYANYSYQSEPVPSFPGLTAAQALAEINLPAKHRANGGASTSIGKTFYTVSASVVDKAFWQDVLDARYNGYTKRYTLVDAVVGAKFNHDNAIIQLRVNNIANEAVQQHVFGDVMKRSFMVELKINAPKK